MKIQTKQQIFDIQHISCAGGYGDIRTHDNEHFCIIKFYDPDRAKETEALTAEIFSCTPPGQIEFADIKAVYHNSAEVEVDKIINKRIKRIAVVVSPFLDIYVTDPSVHYIRIVPINSNTLTIDFEKETLHFMEDVEIRITRRETLPERKSFKLNV